MHTDTNQSTPTRKVPLIDRLILIKSMIATSRLAIDHLHDHGDAAYSDISETLEHVEDLLTTCADEMENMPAIA